MFAQGFFGIINEHQKDTDYIPLKIQEAVAEDIVKDADGKSFSLGRVGLFDYFPENYDQNYQFLILSKGGKIDPLAKLKYTIYDKESVYFEKE